MRSSDSLREEVLQLARSSNTARVKKLDPCGDSHAEEFSRAVHREYLREDSEASCENVQFRAKTLESYGTVRTTNSKNDDKCSKRPEKLIFSSPTVGARNVYAECGPQASHTLQHGPYLRIHPGMNIGLFIQKSACKATCCLLSKGSCFVRYPQIGGERN